MCTVHEPSVNFHIAKLNHDRICINVKSYAYLCRTMHVCDHKQLCDDAFEIHAVDYYYSSLISSLRQRDRRCGIAIYTPNHAHA